MLSSMRCWAMSKSHAKKTSALPFQNTLLYLLFVVVFLFSALYFGYGVFWLVFSFICVVGLYDWTLLLAAYLLTSINQRLRQSLVTYGESAELFLEGETLPLNSGCAFYLYYTVCDAYSAVTLPYKNEKPLIELPLSFEISATEIGIYTCGVSALKICSPWGFFSLRFKAPNRWSYGFPQYLTVIPRVLTFPFTSEDDISRRANEGDEAFASGSRAYEKGDALHLINWKKTAILRKLMVKEFSSRLEDSACIVYLGSLPASAPERHLTIEAAYSAAWFIATERKDDILFHYAATFHDSIRYSEANLQKLAFLLATLDYRESISDAEELKQIESFAGATPVVAVLSKSLDSVIINRLCRLPLGSMVILCGDAACQSAAEAKAALSEVQISVLYSMEKGKIDYVYS